nr:TetR/AcrR family transcriptional regulator [Tessaracoccus sp. MC1756]
MLQAAKDLLAENLSPPSMAQVGKRAGLARSSVYQYFSSPDDLLQKVMEDVLPGWLRRVNERVSAAGSPGERVWAYIEANVALFTGPEQAIATTLAQALEPQVLQGPMEHFHAELQVPLVEALTDLGEPQVAEATDILNAMTVRACQPVRAGEPAPSAEESLALVRRLLQGYLGLQ